MWLTMRIAGTRSTCATTESHRYSCQPIRGVCRQRPLESGRGRQVALSTSRRRTAEIDDVSKLCRDAATKPTCRRASTPPGCPPAWQRCALCHPGQVGGPQHRSTALGRTSLPPWPGRRAPFPAIALAAPQRTSTDVRDSAPSGQPDPIRTPETGRLNRHLEADMTGRDSRGPIPATALHPPPPRARPGKKHLQMENASRHHQVAATDTAEMYIGL